MKDQKAQIAAGFIVGLIIGVVGVMIWHNSSNSKSPAQTATIATSTTEGNSFSSTTPSLIETDAPGAVVGDGPGIVVNEQSPGKTVVISQVALLKPGWVAIRDNVNGKPGNILGAKLFDKGKHSGIVELLRPMVIGKKYFAELRSDDGNYKNFDAQKDVAIKDAKGNTIIATFAVTQASDRQQ